MAVPSSGQLREYADIGVELGVAQTNVSLRGMSQTAGFSTPDAMSEFYGYSSNPCTDIVNDHNPFGTGGLALYQLNGNANDSSGSWNGTASNVAYGTGVFGQAGVFNGSSSKITTSITTNNIGVDFNNRLSNFTFSAWFNTTALDGNDRRILSIGEGAGGGYKYIGFKKVNSEVRFEWYTGATGGGVIHPISTDTWYNIVGVREDGYLKLYINGSFIGQAAQTINNSITSSATLTIGAHTPSTNWFNGSIDQVRIFNEALTPLEVEALYTEELCICDGTVDTLDILGDGSCIATYQLDGNANDLSGNYSGTPANVSYGVGEFDLAAVFNGSSSYIDAPSPIGQLASNANDNFTVSIWLNFNSIKTSGYDTIIARIATAQSPFNIYLYGRPGNYAISLERTFDGKFHYADGYNTQMVYPFSAGVWYNLVVTYVGATKIASAYVNGSQVPNPLTLIQRTTGNSMSQTMRFGGDVGAFTFNGSIDQVRIFNKALSSSEVTTLYNETACTKVTRTAGVTQILGDSSCISYLKLDGDATDETGNYTTSVTNVDYGVGEFGQAGYFNQVYSSRIEYNAAILPTNIFSVSMWMKVTNLSDNKWILTQYTSGVAARFVFNYNADGALQINTPGNSLNSITENPIRNNVWQHIVLIKNGSSGWEIYVDNRSIGTWSDTTNITTNYNTVFGGNQNITDRSIDGQLDNIRVFNKAVSASEVTTLYNEGI